MHLIAVEDDGEFLQPASELLTVEELAYTRRGPEFMVAQFLADAAPSVLLRVATEMSSRPGARRQIEELLTRL